MRKLGTKAETLQMIYDELKYAKVLPQYTFTVEDWKMRQDKVKRKFGELEWKQNVIIRSSSLNEDTSEGSAAGKYETVANVRGMEEFIDATERVIVSYDDNNLKNQILVQPMLQNTRICGVAFTLEPSTFGNYYVVNYDETGSTSSVTSGQGTDNKLYYQFKSSDTDIIPDNDMTEMQQICRALRELEQFFGQDNLDVEFAIDEQGIIYILQVRSLCIRKKPIAQKKQQDELERIVDKIKRDGVSKPFLCGKKTIYSVMADWNPAEMIGIRPKPLALSLYREIITDNVWAYQRDNYGYRNLRSFPLMVDFCGLPYIDVRVSFNSFIPAELEEELSEKLVNYYIDRLSENPAKHDKVEFDIVFSCYTLDLPERIQILKEYGFTEEEIQRIVDALRNVTNHIIDHKDGLWRKDYAKIDTLNQRYREIMESNLGDIEKVYWLLEDCKRYGTLPFAGLARAAFIAVQILTSLVTCGIITSADYSAFMNGINTVSSEMNADFQKLSRTAFLQKYGHLRPGTYDITSLRYDEAPDLYFDWKEQGRERVKEPQQETFRLSLEQLNTLKQKLYENGLTNDILEIMDFIRTAVEGREYGKFAFTRNLSKAIQLIGEIGGKEGIAKEDCAYLNIRAILASFSSTKNIRENLLQSLELGKKDYCLTQSITLPPVILKPEDAVRFYYPDSEPNFITLGKVCSPVQLLANVSDVADIEGKIVLIPSADPGYDWIFARGITGFITKYGGANSHMAIRAGEIGIPAAVGVGTKQFERYRHAKILELDAQSKMIKILQ